MKKENSYGKNMKLVTSYWGNDSTSFKLIPVSNDCPYAEVIYIPDTTLMVVISKIKKENFQMLNKLDDNGDIEYSKTTGRDGKKQPKQRRTQVEIFQEYYIINFEEQEEFIKEFAVNADTYNYKQFLRNIDGEANAAIKTIEKPALVNADGAVLTK